MRKFIPKLALAAAGLAFALGLGATTAMADVRVKANITKDKDVSIDETITITKIVNLWVNVDLVVNKAAEADAIVNQQNYNNEACENCAEKLDWILNSIGGAAELPNVGIIAVNQAAGNMNNQGSVVSVAVDDDSGTPTPTPEPTPSSDRFGFANAQASVDQTNGVWKQIARTNTSNPPNNNLPNGGDDLSVTPNAAGNIINSINLLFREARIEDSIIANLGVIHVNQATGNINNQANVLALAVALGEGVALAEADLGQLNANNFVNECGQSDCNSGILKTALLSNSLRNNFGIVGVNQTSGNLANQANVVGLGVAVAPGS